MGVPWRVGMEFENPTNDIERALTDGTLSPTAAILELQSQIKEQGAVIKALSARLGGDPPAHEGQPIEFAVRSVFGRLTESAPNWHQACVFFASSTAGK